MGWLVWLANYLAAAPHMCNLAGLWQFAVDSGISCPTRSLTRTAQVFLKTSYFALQHT